MMLHEGTRIAGRKTVADWLAFKNRLKGSNDPTIWKDAFTDFFEARLDSRYFAPIRAIEELNQNIGEGFAIVALQCSLIEFLATTIRGKTFRDVKNADLKKHEYGRGESRNIFVDFLQTHVPFKEMFSNEKLAIDFYSNVRCGLLHEAQTRAGWRIRVCPSAAMAIDAIGRVVYRDKMQDAFDQFLDWYKQQLCEDAELQTAFIRKFDALCHK